jgi:hypothetical protein
MKIIFFDVGFEVPLLNSGENHWFFQNFVFRGGRETSESLKRWNNGDGLFSGKNMKVLLFLF